jgi:carboxymethylenebutenolidase
MCHQDAPANDLAAAVATLDVEIAATDGAAIPVNVAGDDGAPAVVLCTDIYGRSPFYRYFARRLAAEGFRSYLPDVFHRVGELEHPTHEAALARRVRLDDCQAIDDLAAVIDHARRNDSDVVGVIGFCLGGTMALNLAAANHGLATVCFYGFPAGTPPLTESSPPVPLDVASAMSGPILGFWGTDDERVGIDNVHALDERLGAAEVDHAFTLYPGLGHGFMAAIAFDPEQPGYEHAADAWDRTAAFLREQVLVGPGG